MKIQDHPLYGGKIQTLIDLLRNDAELSDISIEKINSAIKSGYHVFYVPKKNGSKRIIEAPNDYLKLILSALAQNLQLLDCPEYNFCGWKKQNTLQNAQTHINANAYLVSDISEYYPNTKAKYVRDFWKKFNTDEESLDILVKLTTYHNHLPTGAPTSPILVFLTHEELFNQIYKKMKEQGIKVSLYADDITLSSKHGITNSTVKYIQSVLKKHKLLLKPEKTKHFSYKKAKITGYYILQNGKLSVPYCKGHDVVKMLKEKPIKDMTENELLKVLGKIEYIRKIDKNAFKIKRLKIVKQLKQVQALKYITTVMGYFKYQNMMYQLGE